jgi:hypothetical protein
VESGQPVPHDTVSASLAVPSSSPEELDEEDEEEEEDDEFLLLPSAKSTARVTRLPISIPEADEDDLEDLEDLSDREDEDDDEDDEVDPLRKYLLLLRLLFLFPPDLDEPEEEDDEEESESKALSPFISSASAGGNGNPSRFCGLSVAPRKTSEFSTSYHPILFRPGINVGWMTFLIKGFAAGKASLGSTSGCIVLDVALLGNPGRREGEWNNCSANIGGPLASLDLGESCVR